MGKLIGGVDKRNGSEVDRRGWSRPTKVLVVTLIFVVVGVIMTAMTHSHLLSGLLGH